MPFVELAIERAAHNQSIPHGRAERIQMLLGEFSVRMLKDEHFTTRQRGALIHLQSTVGLGHAGKLHANVPGWTVSGRVVPSADDNDLGVRRERFKSRK